MRWFFKIFSKIQFTILLKFNRLNHVIENIQKKMLKELLNFISVKTPFFKSKYQQQNNFWTFRLMFLGLNAIYIILICIHHEKIWLVFFYLLSSYGQKFYDNLINHAPYCEIFCKTCAWCFDYCKISLGCSIRTTTHIW